MTIQAISFDLWDTLVVDDSDEAKRAAQSLRSKREERRYLTWQAVKEYSDLSLEQVTLGFDVLDAAFNKMWHDQFVTWPVDERLAVLLKGLGCQLPEHEFRKLIDVQSQMEVVIPPEAIDGVHAALENLSGRYRMCVVSDAVFTPGRCLRELLAHHDLERFFEAFVFSDEAGRSKPHRSVFDAAAQKMCVPLANMVHIGDRQHNDVEGAHAVGMKAILFTASRAIDEPGNTADAVCGTYAELPRIIDSL